MYNLSDFERLQIAATLLGHQISSDQFKATRVKINISKELLKIDAELKKELEESNQSNS